MCVQVDEVLLLFSLRFIAALLEKRLITNNVKRR